MAQSARPVLSVIVRRFRHDVQKDVENLVEKAERAVSKQAGFIRLQSSLSSKGDSCELVTVFLFDTRDNLDKWENSSVRREIIEKLDVLSSANLTHTKFEGISLLASPKASVRKIETVVILIFWILIMGRLLGMLSHHLMPILFGQFARDALVITVNVLLISYILLPWSIATLERLKTRFSDFAGGE